MATTAELLAAWQDATRASELAERLATAAAEVADQLDRDAAALDNVVELAEATAAAAERAAESARGAARRAAQLAADNREHRLAEANAAALAARVDQGTARDRYEDSERRSHDGHDANA